MAKINIKGIEAREAAIKGAEHLVDIVGSTLGPFGSNVLLEKGNKITNDGYTVSKEVAPSIVNEFERRGALAIHEASAKTNDQVGDATSTAEVLAMSIVKQCVKRLPQKGEFGSKMKPSEIINQLKKEKDEVLEKLERMAIPIKTKAELVNSALVSVENEDLARMIGETQYELGKDGMILAEETNERGCGVELIKGIRIDNGLGLTSLINNPEKQTFEMDDAKVILTSHVLQDLQPIEALLEHLFKKGLRKVLIIARGFSSGAIQACKENYDKGVMQLCPLNAPYTDMKEVMLDLEAVTGAKYFDSEEKKLNEMQVKDLGTISKIVAKRYSAIIAGSNDALTTANVEIRIENLKKQLKGETSDFQKKLLQQRIAQMQNGFALLKIGAETEIERKRLKDKADDAVSATKLAFLGGVVPGAGVAFKQIAEEMPEDSLLRSPLMSVYEQIMDSAPEGYQVPEWCRDPYLVLKSALDNAVSVAGVFSSIGGIVTEENKKTCNCNV